jgi:hypothetical protein
MPGQRASTLSHPSAAAALTGDLILIRVLPLGLFPQDGACDLRERPTVGDRWEPLGSDGVWTKRGPGAEPRWRLELPVFPLPPRSV